MFECASPAKKFSPKIANEKNFLSTQQIQKKLKQQFYIEEKNKQVHLQIKMHLKNIKIEEYKKTWSTKYQRINTQPIKTKNNQIHLQNKIHNEHFNNIDTTGKYKKLNMTEHKTEMNVTKIDKYKKTEQHFYDGAQSRHEHY